MRTEIKTYRVTCDRCPRSIRVRREEWDNDWLPKGWGSVLMRDLGRTNYTRYDDLCPACLKKAKEQA